MPNNCKSIIDILTSNLAPEVKSGVAGGQVVSQGLEGEIELSALLNVEGAAVGLDVFEL